MAQATCEQTPADLLICQWKHNSFVSAFLGFTVSRVGSGPWVTVFSSLSLLSSPQQVTNQQVTKLLFPLIVSLLLSLPLSRPQQLLAMPKPQSGRTELKSVASGAHGRKLHPGEGPRSAETAKKTFPCYAKLQKNLNQTGFWPESARLAPSWLTEPEKFDLCAL
eukprot:1344986-Amphidinium_carterae.1